MATQLISEFALPIHHYLVRDMVQVYFPFLKYQNDLWYIIINSTNGLSLYDINYKQ